MVKRVLEIAQKRLDLISGLPIIVLCALKRAARTFKNEEPESGSEIVQRARFILDKRYGIIYTNCSKVLHQMIAPKRSD